MSAPEDDPLAELAWPEPPAPGQQVSDAIRRHCTENLRPHRGLGRELRAGISVAALGAVALWLAAGMGTPHLARAALLGAFGWGLVALAVLFTGLARPPGRRIGRERRIAMAALLPLLFLAYLALSAEARLPLREFFDGPVELAAACALNALLAGAAATSALLWLWRRTDPMSPAVSGALIGLIAGIAGAVGVGAGCAADEAWHLVAGHGLGVAVLALAGSFVGRRWLAP
ncbi:MAG TPA: NrsF family protein [Polyangiaceae bacterium]